MNQPIIKTLYFYGKKSISDALRIKVKKKFLNNYA